MMRGGLVIVCAWAALPLLVACVVQETAAPPRAVQVMAPPPVAMQEQPGARPDAVSIWVAGYWHWAGEKYVWIPGHWDHAPSGTVWSGPRYSIREGSSYYEPGGWVPQRSNAPR